MTEFKEGCPVYCILLKNDGEILIQCENDGRIMAFPTKKHAIDFWENGYKSAFARGICGATGAMITMIQCSPRIVYFNNRIDLIEKIFNEPPYNKIGICSGSIYGILCQKDVKQLWKEGIEPELLERI